ncbi:uncharacterized protein [Nicotiana tomentosiformis]|uniref:uncharacterized protein n=1 Tax=Nicotiana tomentosiformis TaxID=4098 RepID=UPI00051B4EB2|nr:uncharacterized protein LOC117277332 [Nicotiana tomentosiformis]
MFVSLGCLETKSTELIGFRLEDVTGQWWRGYKKARDSTLPPLTWPQFKEAFRAKLFPNNQMDELRRQFEDLKQGTMSVTEYETEFTNLEEYAPNLIPTEREKLRRIIECLNPHMAKDMTSHHGDNTYFQVVNIATRKEEFGKIAREAR